MSLKDFFAPRNPKLTISIIELENGHHVICLNGHFDAAQSYQAEQQIMDITEHSRGIIMDLNEMRFVGSAGLRVFLVVAKKLKRQCVPFHFCCLNPEVQKVFELSCFHTIFNIHQSRDEALQRLVASYSQE